MFAPQSSPEGAAGMTERRLARRYDLSLPVTVRLPINREPKSHSGQTRDISTRGVYFTMGNDLAPGTELDFTLTLPSEITHGSEVFVRAHGRVVRVDKRVEETQESVGVAAVIERYDIIRGEGTHV
jgi:PilZ domain